MGTSESGDAPPSAADEPSPAGGPWIAGVAMYSGRPDPTWPVDEAAARRLLALWSELPVSAGPAPTAPALGYRGCFMRDSTGREWFAYGGTVTLRSARRAAEARLDRGRRFERLVLSTAPGGLLPDGIND